MAGDGARSLEDAISPYMAIMRDYLDGRIADVDVEAAFNSRYLKDTYMWPDSVFNQLDAVFAVAEEFEPDPEVRATVPFATDPAEMRRVITTAYEKLSPMFGGA